MSKSTLVEFIKLGAWFLAPIVGAAFALLFGLALARP
jgi:phosphate/sulfate permease